ncbi:DsbA family protein [Leucobacter sp. NPDC015123]|uniref:DsbA family protein n=1 Tax=Leucobacter sp. NPDC015123 TaxID=3364129 RepID=UPI0036F47EC1
MAAPNGSNQRQAPSAGVSGGRLLPIAGLVVGAAGAVAAVIGAFAGSVPAYIAVGLGVVAVALGVVSLARRRRGPAAIGGLVLGAAALVFGIATLVSAAPGQDADLPPQGEQGEQAEQGQEEQGEADAPAGEALVWPKNMSTGGVIVAGPDAKLLTSEALPDSATPTPRTADELGQPALIQIYLDYRCPYCSVFEDASGEVLNEVLEMEAAAIEIHPLTFLDRASAGSYYSSRTAGAIACLADAQPDAAWATHNAFLAPEFQPTEGQAGHTNDELIAEIERVAGSVSPEARSCISEERFVPVSQALNDWVFANPVPFAGDPGLKVTSVPLVVVKGTPYEGDPSDPAEFRKFLSAQGVL